MNKAHGWDHLSIIMTKACGNSISLPLKLIFKSMINEGVFPEDWKNSNLVPIHEKESKNLIKNYRLISLLSIFSKLFERLVFNALFNIIVQKKPIQSLSVWIHTWWLLCFSITISHAWNLPKLQLSPTRRYKGHFSWYL